MDLSRSSGGVPGRQSGRLPLLLLGLFASGAWAADLPGSADWPDYQRFPRAQIVAQQDLPNEERRYPQDGIKRIGGQLRAAQQVQATGHLRSLTYQLPGGHAPAEALQAASRQWLGQGARLLFSCSGRLCGSSSLWANQVFANAMLYGPEEQQSYALMQLQSGNLLALYGITRGNRKAYLHLEQLEPGTPLPALYPAAATVLKQLREQGELDWRGLAGVPPAAWLELLAQALNLDSTLHVQLIGAEAESWRAALVQQGVRGGRLSLQNDGEGLRVRLSQGIHDAQ